MAGKRCAARGIMIAMVRSGIGLAVLVIGSGWLPRGAAADGPARLQLTDDDGFAGMPVSQVGGYPQLPSYPCYPYYEPGGEMAADPIMGEPGEIAPVPTDLAYDTGLAFASTATDTLGPGYIDDAVVRSMFRLRVDAGFDNPFPDRGEFFYAQCGCFPGGPGPGIGPVGNDPAELATSVDHQEISLYFERAFNHRFSAFCDLPIRLVQFELDPAVPNAIPIEDAGGVSDFQFGFKYAVRACPTVYDTFQVRIFTPTANEANGIGTGHFSIETAFLTYQQLTQRLQLNGEARLWVPFSDSEFNGEEFEAHIVRYGLGLTYDIAQPGYGCGGWACQHRVSAVTEVVGWTVLDGLKFNPLSPQIDASGDTIVNVKLGGRWSCEDWSVYMGYGRALTGDTWYQDIMRMEISLVF